MKFEVDVIGFKFDKNLVDKLIINWKLNKYNYFYDKFER